MIKHVLALTIVLITNLAHSKAMDQTFTTERTFQSDAKSVFHKLVTPELYTQWMGPAGAEMYFKNSNIKVGGTSLWAMKTPDGMLKYGQLHYKNIEPNKLFVYTQNFADENGKFIKAPFSATYPDTLLTTMTLTEKSPKITTLTVKWEIVGKPSEIEVKTFNDFKKYMGPGWNDSFDKLAKLLKK